ncbi:hypothetical protein ACS0TY_002654 [Phlomoides rotata]
MESVEKDQPLSPTGRLLTQRRSDQVINCVLAAKHPIPLDSLKADIKKSIMLKHPRFCSLMVIDGSGRENWRRTEVDVDRHLIIRHHRLSDDPSVSDEDAINDYIANLTYSSPLSFDKPLWEMHALAAHNAVIFRVHHALGDGISLMSMLLSYCRKADDPTQMPTIGGVGSATTTFGPRRWSVWTLVKFFWFTFIYVVEFGLRVLWLRDKRTAVSGGSGVELWPRRLVSARFCLDDMKTVKRAVAYSTINDVLFGIISSGLSRYLDIRSSKGLQNGVQITGLAMVNLRPQTGLQDFSKLMDCNSGARWGNKFGVILLPVYYHRGDSDPLQFVRRAKAMIDTKKLSLEAPFSYKLMDLIIYFLGPKFASYLKYRIVCNTTFTISNVIGPREEITLCGNPVKHIRVTSSSLPHAITMHMVSYAGIADLQILVAKDIIPDPKVLAKCFEDALIEMKNAAEVALKS